MDESLQSVKTRHTSDNDNDNLFSRLNKYVRHLLQVLESYNGQYKFDSVLHMENGDDLCE